MVREWYRKGDDLLREIRETKVPEGSLAVWYIGQCGFVWKGAVTVYIDPVLNDLADEAGHSRRYYTWPFEPEEVQADYVICTHGHADHMALDTLTGIAEGNAHTKFIVPGACRQELIHAGVDKERVLAANAKTKMELPGIAIYPIRAAHPVHMVDENGFDTALSYSITMNGVQLLHLGDTYLTDQLLADLKELPSPQIFFPPINGGDYFRTARDCIGNLSALESAELAAILRADLTIPTHFDMIEGNTVDPCDFVRKLWERNPAARFYIPALGERYLYL